MNHWPFIIAAYALTIAGMGGILLISWLRMHKAEADAEAVRGK